MDTEKLKEAFGLVKQDIGDLYNKIADLSDKIEEVRVAQLTFVDKMVAKPVKTSKKAKKKTGKKR